MGIVIKNPFGPNSLGKIKTNFIVGDVKQVDLSLAWRRIEIIALAVQVK